MKNTDRPNNSKKGVNVLVAFTIEITGRVQGVGYRPFVFRLAIEAEITGWIKNICGNVLLHIEGEQKRVYGFLGAILTQTPILADPVIISKTSVEPLGLTDFHIEKSDASSKGEVFIPPDMYMCKQCELEIVAPTNNRYHYPFINCCECGPRYSIIKSMPYDRPHTTMNKFKLCPGCEQEYSSPSNRRFHAQPIACPLCGPNMELFDLSGKTKNTDEFAAIDSIVERIRAGDVIALKSVGGYHLICNAQDEKAVACLRRRKARPDKPFAVMFPALSQESRIRLLTACVDISAHEIALLNDSTRPILLAKTCDNTVVARNVNPSLSLLGVMLPCSALHHLILEKFEGPIVATSGNINGEPVITQNIIAQHRLRSLTDYFVHHNRDIARPIDDSIVRFVAGKSCPIRVARGFSPTELTLPYYLDEPVLGVGANQKNTVSLAWKNRLVVSPHIGDLNSPAMQSHFESAIAEIQNLYGVNAKKIITDLHPGYISSKWAKQSGCPVESVQHHHAHASAWALDTGSLLPSLVFVWDGVGLGENGRLWGGEAFWGLPGSWVRVASFLPIKLQGGNIVANQPWRSAAGMKWRCGDFDESFEEYDKDGLMYAAWKDNVNCHLTSAVGRLFDGAAFLSIGTATTTFEGQAAICFEGLFEQHQSPTKLPLNVRHNNIIEVDWRPLVPSLCDVNLSGKFKSEVFHSSLVQVICDVAQKVSERYEIEKIGLVGGVFQNCVLVEGAVKLLNQHGFNVALPNKLPVNDASISAGQVHEYAMRRAG